MGSKADVKPMRLVLFWVVAQTLVFEKTVSAARMRGKFVKPESNTSIIDRIPKEHAVESVEPHESFEKRSGLGVVGEGTKVASENERQQSWLTRKTMESDSRLLFLVAGHVEQSDAHTLRELAAAIDYSGPSTHPPPRGH